MAISPASKRAADEVAEADVAAEKAQYAERLRTLQATVEPPLTNLELSIGLELDDPHQRRAASQVGRFLSVAPRNRRARPDRATRALIDRLVEGDAALCVRAAAAPGLPREVLICEPRETARLGPEWTLIRLGDRPLPGATALPPSPIDDDDFDFSGGAAEPTPAPSPAPVRPSSVPVGPKPVATAARPSRSEPIEAPPLPPLPPSGPRALGPWRVPPIGLGLMRLSTAGRPDEAAAVALVRRALDAGVRLLDTADAYATGPEDLHHNEALVRRALEGWDGPRDEVVVATKVGLTRPAGRWVPDGRPEHLRAAVDRSLRALGVERLDLLQLHVPDPKVPLAESLGALADLQRAGKIRALGVCNLRPTDVHVALDAADLVSLQARFNPYDKASWTNGLLHAARARGLSFIAHSPLGGHGGVGRVVKDKVLAEVAARLGASPHEVALAWLTTLDPGLVLIPGATRPESVDSIARAAALDLDDDARRALAARFRWSRQRPDAEPAPDSAPSIVGAPVPVVDIALEQVCAAPRDEVVLLMGMPALGKTSAVRRFTDAGYVRLNRDRAGGKLDDLLPVLEGHHARGARRFVLDNTYTLRKMRAGVLATARRLGLPVRCVWMGGTLEDARYNAALRLFRKLGRMPTPEEIVARGKHDPNTFPPAVLDRFAASAEPVDSGENVERVQRVPFSRHDPPDYTTRALLLDLDGTLRRTKSGSPFPTAPDDVVLLPGRREILAPLVADGVRLFGVTNQAGVSLGQVDEATVRAACDRTAALLELPIEVVWCPHPPGRPTCWCRKPLPGLGVALIERWRLSRADLAMVGDRESDAAFAAGLGVTYHDAADFFG